MSTDQCSTDSLCIHIFWEDQQCGPHIQLVDDYRFYICVLKHKLPDDIWTHECLGQCLWLFQLNIKNHGLWELSAIGINGTCAVEEVNII